MRSELIYRQLCRQRPWLVAALLVIWTVLASGFPIAVVNRKVGGDEIYPCMNCPCGCVSAAVCWDKCCCLSDDQKIIWAKKNGVAPPEFLVRRVAKTVDVTARATGCCCAKKSCVTPASQTDRQSTVVDPSKSAMKSKVDRESESAGASLTVAEAEQENVMVTGWAAARCRGIDLLWQTLTSGVAMNETVRLARPPMIARWTPSFVGQGVCRSSVDPPVPR